jgi:hypothetical protein
VGVWIYKFLTVEVGKRKPQPIEKRKYQGFPLEENLFKIQTKKVNEKMKKIMRIGVNPIKSPIITPMNVAQRSNWWPRLKPQSQNKVPTMN